jgi:xanthine dehydrogenase accessory factor
VRTAALDALETGVGVLLRVLPDSDDVFPQTAGASIVVNPCLSGGALEIYLEPLLPSPLLYVVGTSPIAQAVATLAPTLGFTVGRATEGAWPDGAVAAVVSSHGGDEPTAIRAALDAGIGFVGIVCSHTRGEAVLAELDLTDEERLRVHTHVGIDIGARTAPEIALSILAEVVRRIRLEGLAASPGREPLDRPLQAVDPVCGMTVTVGAETSHAIVDGIDYWFCNPGCRDVFVADRAS